MIFQFIIIQINYITLALLSFVILSVRQLLDVSKDGVLSQSNLQSLTPVILSLSKDGGFIEENLRRIPRHFDTSQAPTQCDKKNGWR